MNLNANFIAPINLKIMLIRLVVFFLIFLQFSCSQDFVEAKEIAKTLKFKAINDTVNGIYYDTAIFHDKERTVVVVYKQDTIGKGEEKFSETGQVSVLQKMSGKFKIIDSSALFDRDGHGPQAFFSEDTLRIEHSYHHGGYTLFYTFDIKTKKYKLVLVETHNLLYENEDQNNVSTGTEILSYNVVRQELTTNKFEFDESDNEKLKTTQTIKRKIPEKLIPDLAHFVDPEYDESGIYDEIFK